MEIYESNISKELISENYNFRFNKQTGLFLRWGRVENEDPDFSEFGPEILDLEISVGRCRGNCPFCYKRNGSNLPTRNMSFDKFKEIFHSLPRTLTQIAFGITDIDAHPNLLEIFRYTREQGIIPNFTTNGFGVDAKFAMQVSEVCGAVAVSVIDREVTYNAVKAFCDAGMEQVNIHYLLSEETIDGAFRTIEDIASDGRLAGVNAIVFLNYKPKGRGRNHFTPLRSIEPVKKIITHALLHKVGFGFDSCSAPMYYKSVEGTPLESTKTFVEACEAGLFSLYGNVDGEFYPCSFIEREAGWEIGERGDDFVEDVWKSTRMASWRKSLLNSSNCKCKFSPDCRSCPVFDSITPCKIHDVISLPVIRSKSPAYKLEEGEL